MEDFIGKYDGNQIDSRLDKVKDMVGATASGAGAAGLVPAPAAEKRTAFLRGDGTWQDIDVHEPGFLSDNFYDENDFRYILFNIAFNEVSTITQEQYDIIASKCEVDKSMQYLLLGLSTAYGVGDVIITKDSSENIQAVLRTGGKVEFGYMLSYNVIIDISKDLTFTSSISQYTVHMVDNQSKDIALTISDQNGDNRIINFSTAGAGTKALMDDGKYRKLPVYGRNLLLGSGKEVSNSNYNIADYWLTEPISKGTQVTLTIFGELGDDKEMFTIYNSTGAVGSMAQFSKADFVNGKASKTFKWITNIGDAVADNTHMVVFSSPKTGTSTSTIHKIKLEYGDISTEWSPAWEDIPDLEERYAYGVEWDTASSSPDGVRVGNMQLHRELPIQSKMKGAVLDNKGGINKYLGTSWSDSDVQLASGEPENFSIMTMIPRHWYKFYFNGTKFRCMISAIPLPGYKYVDDFFISSYEATIYRSKDLLMSRLGVDSTYNEYRGGDNTAEWDGTYRSLLGRPVTNLTRDQFRQAARKRGSGWEMYTYNAHKILFWLFAVEYATLDSQKPFNAQKDANGFAQGGLGPGLTQMTDWTNFNNANPLIPCGYTNEFGNGSGEKAYVVKNASGGTHATLMANRYRGIENPFGHIWKYTDGANIQVTTGDAGLSILWTTDDPSNFSDTSYTGYDKKGNICRTNGYAKKMLLGEDGDIVPTEVGGSSSTYWCDYYYTYASANRMQVVLVGGSAVHGPHAGFTYVSTSDALSDVSCNVGSRLCFFPEFRKTSA